MLTHIDVGVIVGGAIAFIFLLMGMKGREARRKQFLISTVDPFTGTWREQGGLAEMGKMAITPSGDGLSFRRSMYEKPLLIGYGKEFEDEYPFLERMSGLPPIMATVVRVDDHTLEFSYRENDKLVFQCIYAVSSNGKQMKATGQYKGSSAKSTLYERVGSVPDGDAFFGVWQSLLPQLTDITIKAEGRKIDWYAGGFHVVKAKFDGKAYRGNNYSSKKATYQFKRLDDHTIEMVIKSEQFHSKQVLQVQNNTLTRKTTYTPKGNQPSGAPKASITEYKRIK